MSDVPIADLEALLRALAQERSLRGRLRVLGHSWQLLRSLSPMDRERVALRLGSKWAWKRVEKTFLKDGELSENEQLVGRAFERMGGADPTELRRLARTIREGDSESARDLLMLTLTEALEEQAEEEEARPAPAAPKHETKPSPEPGEPEPLVDPESLVSEGGVQDVPVPEARLIDRVEDVLTSSRARPVEAPEPSLAPRPEPVAPRAFPAANEVTPAPLEPKPAPAAPQPTPAPPESKAASGPRRESTTAPPPALERPPPRAREPKPAFSTRDRDDSATLEPPAPVAGADRLRVLRALQKSDHPGADLGRAGRAALLESLGGGWASRRALTRMIRKRSLDGLDEALGLVQHLVRPGQQTWCLADLIEHWELDAGQRDRVLHAAPTDAARRRLQRRIANPRCTPGIHEAG